MPPQEWTPQGIVEAFPLPAAPQGAPVTAAAEIDLEDLPAAFASFLEERGLVFAPLDQLDFLAATLGSQFLLATGPSGTGKSTIANALAAFFAPEDRRAKIEAVKNVAKPSEYFGYLSYLADGTFIATEELLRVQDLQHLPAETPPVCVVEEANLSPIEGYLAPVVHALGSIRSERVDFRLHGLKGEAPTESGTAVPPMLVVGPYPRFIGTINVDADARAPARKVVGRACVLLLEPQTLEQSLDAAQSVLADAAQGQDGPARGVLGSPTAAYERAEASGRVQALRAALRPRLQTLKDATNADVATPRDVAQSLCYIAFFVELHEAVEANPDTAAQLGADHAVLHYVLPSLPPEQFTRVLEPLEASASPGSLLVRRLSRLRELGATQHGIPLDFFHAHS